MAPTIRTTKAGTGYKRTNGEYADVEQINILPKQTLAAGQSVSDVFDVGEGCCLRLTQTVSAKTGTNPTLDQTVLTSHDGVSNWRSLGAFAQKTDVGLAAGAVAPTGTNPPTITLTGTPVLPFDAKVECTDTSGGTARGQWLGRYSVDGGVLWTSFTSAATVEMKDADGNTTGVTLNIATGAASVDNRWAAKTAGYEQKTFVGCDRFVKLGSQVGGTSTPTFDVEVVGEVAC